MARKGGRSGIETLIVKCPWWVSALIGAALASAAWWLIPVHAPLFESARGQLAMFLGGGFSLIALLSWLWSFRRRRLFARMMRARDSIEAIRNLSWQDFERLTGEYYRRLGYRVGENPEEGADGGVDLRCHKGGDTLLVQCKHWRREKVGVDKVREFFGVVVAEGANAGAFVTSGRYTPDAAAFGARVGLTLVDGPALLRMMQAVDRGSLSRPGTALANPDTICPRCGGELVTRRTGRGRRYGGSFVGCAAYPQCTYTRAPAG